MNRMQVGVAATAVSLLALGTVPTGAFAAGSQGGTVTISLAERPSPVTSGGVASYTVTLHNTGIMPATKGELVVGLKSYPSGGGSSAAKVISETPPCQGAAGSQACQVPLLAPGQTRTFDFAVRAPSSGYLKANASYTGRTATGSVGGNTETVTTGVVAAPAPTPTSTPTSTPPASPPASLPTAPVPAPAPVAVPGTPRFTG